MERAKASDPKSQLLLFTEEHSHNVTKELRPTTLLEFWNDCFIAEGYGSKAEMEKMFASGKRALTHFFTWWSQEKRSVIAIEKGFSLSVEQDIRLTGRFDRVERAERGLRIIDFKSCSPRGQALVDNDLQLSVYAMAAMEMWQEPIESLVLLSVTEEGIVAETTHRSESDLRKAREEILAVYGGMESKNFTPLPSKEKCKNCPYREICPTRMR